MVKVTPRCVRDCLPRTHARRLGLLVVVTLLIWLTRTPLIREPRDRVMTSPPDWLDWVSDSCVLMGVCPSTDPPGPSGPLGQPCLKPPWMKRSEKFSLGWDQSRYFAPLGNVTCFKGGTNISRVGPDTAKCPCIPGWNGQHCSFPDEMMRSNLAEDQIRAIKPRLDRAPRRIIHAFPFNNEFEMLEARLAELHALVDVFLVLESNYTASGQPKALRLLERLRAGHYSEYACKIVHVFLDHFPAGARKNGWLADNLLRNHLAQQGLVRQLHNFTSDDIFLMTDADELPYPSTLWFLRLHDGYPEPIGYYLSANVFGFFWQGTRRHVHVICAVTVGLLTQVLENHAIQIRSAPHYLEQNSENLHIYRKTHPHINVSLWSFGTKTQPAGWHCSWCCKPDCIRTKLLSAQYGDFPRWGDYPEKTNISYISKLIDNGTWFDNVSRFTPRVLNQTKNYAPPFVLQHFQKYNHILVKPKLYETGAHITADKVVQ